MEIEHAVVIERPRDEVWALFDDPEMLLQWQEKLVAYEQVDGAPSEIGSVSKQIVRRSSGEVALTVTLVDRRPPEFSESQYEGMQLPFTIASTFKDLGDGRTEWHAVVDVRLSLMTKALGPVLKGSLAGLVEDNGEAFKRFAEAR